MKTLVVGGGAREAAIAKRLGEESSVNVVMPHENPTLVELAQQTHGQYSIGNVTDGKFIADFAKSNNIDIAFVSSDTPLEAGVCDHLLATGIKTVGPTRSGAELEWNKAYARKFLSEIAPEFAPQYWIADDSSSVNSIFEFLERENIQVAVKPQGLTNGKGVKVMGEHLTSFEDAKNYSLDIIKKRIGKSDCVVIEEKLDGIEFTIQALTDGYSVACPPATYDFPFRYENDKGPGTGGMGCFTDNSLLLPFMSNEDYLQCISLIEKIVRAITDTGRHFNGVLNTGFFLSPMGLKVMEFNARFGDPECINIMELLDSSLLSILDQIVNHCLQPAQVLFKQKASVVKYLVAPEYAIAPGNEHIFTLNTQAIQQSGVNVLFASSMATQEATKYKTIGNSRNVALVTTGDTVPEAAAKIDFCLQSYFSGTLEFRNDIGSRDMMEKFYSFRKGRIK